MLQPAAMVTATNLSYDGSLGAGASSSFGFQATWDNSTDAAPAVSCAAVM